MTLLSLSPEYNAVQEGIIFPFFAENIHKAQRKSFADLSRAQTRAVKQAFKNTDIHQEGVFPIFSSDSTVYVYFLGKEKDYDSRSAREAGEKIFGLAKKFRLSSLSVSAGTLWKDASLKIAFFEGVALGTYEFNEYKGDKFVKSQEESGAKPVEKITLLSSENILLQERITVLSESVRLTKDIINTPPSIATPSFVEKIIKEKFAKIKNTKVSVVSQKELTKLGAGGILGVGQASDEESRFLIVEYKGGKKEAPLALVGKGVTYDTGGLSLKPAQYMLGMKQDLGGCATVMGAVFAAASLKIKKNIVVLTPLAENLVSRDAYKPDDVLTMMNGKTVEVINTDAEGRLLLADALTYTERTFSPRAIVDLATLTGACAYAVGNDFAAVLSTNKALTSSLVKASDKVGEPIWELPLHARYEKLLSSPIADLLNSASKLKAGTIEGGLFLKNFVTDKTPWCHMDIASVAFDDNERVATGRQVRLLIDWMENF